MMRVIETCLSEPAVVDRTLARKRHGYPRWRLGREPAVSVSRPAAEPPILHDADVRAVRAQLQGDY